MLLWIHVVVLLLVGVLRGESLAVCLLAPGLVAGLSVAAMRRRLSQNVRALLATTGLLTSSAILIDFFDGLIEAHFHFFVVIAVVSLYQSWRPYLAAVGFVLAHHLVLGTLVPADIYNHQMAVQNPWLFAVVHASAILAESVACLVFWKLTETTLDAERDGREALQRTNTQLSAANSAVADLVAMLSHDLRVPLTVLIGRTEMALETWSDMTPADQIEYVRKVGRSGQTMHAVLEDTLCVSALDGDGVHPRPTSVRLADAVRDALDLLPEPLSDVDLWGLGDPAVVVDRRHLDQVLTNLFSNSVKYGGDRLAVHARTEGRYVELRICDSGAGVPAAFVPRLFERFTRSEEARGGAQKGTGLGLYITRSLLRANGGDITYEPTPGGGATFCVQLPAAPAGPSPSESAPRRSGAEVVGVTGT